MHAIHVPFHLARRTILHASWKALPGPGLQRMRSLMYSNIDLGYELKQLRLSGRLRRILFSCAQCVRRQPVQGLPASQGMAGRQRDSNATTNATSSATPQGKQGKPAVIGRTWAIPKGKS
ncbi:hypothetical protein J8I26_07355 [Herbaspirillum sp. LeCh32-8]|uniref:hypothetical protein n=1 Tax=Herbaspirillum sp. LeCh32-8 TaxID=2821356 RepID=UPI001AE813A1|nr:hypothetical protein [Herbaspirillum sp. LeCh32-8]MBP0597911.1 hypothetical protein [Herbaspirillum sp. LeCh32-8]